jgi:magnesium transporter
MFRSRHPTPGSSPATLLPLPAECDAQKPVIKLVEYDLHSINERVVENLADLPDPTLKDGKVRWLDVDGLGDIEVLKAVGEKYGLHPLALEDVLNMGQRPKVDTYDEHLFIVMDMVYYDGERRMCGEQISMFLCENILITVQEEIGQDVFDPVRARLHAGRGYIRKSGADYLTYALIDSIIDHCFPVLELLGDSIDKLEDDVLVKPTRDLVQKIQHNKRTLMQLRRYVWPTRDVVTALLHDDKEYFTEQTKVFLRDCYDHTIRLMDLLETYRDVNSGLMDLYLSAVSMKTNEIMRVLTIISSIFIPLTFVAGVYGMNFDGGDGPRPLNMPELYQPYGYIVCLSLMLCISIGQIILFRRKKWL